MRMQLCKYVDDGDGNFCIMIPVFLNLAHDNANGN